MQFQKTIARSSFDPRQPFNITLTSLALPTSNTEEAVSTMDLWKNLQEIFRNYHSKKRYLHETWMQKVGVVINPATGSGTKQGQQLNGVLHHRSSKEQFSNNTREDSTYITRWSAAIRLINYSQSWWKPSQSTRLRTLLRHNFPLINSDFKFEEVGKPLDDCMT